MRTEISDNALRIIERASHRLETLGISTSWHFLENEVSCFAQKIVNGRWKRYSYSMEYVVLNSLRMGLEAAERTITGTITNGLGLQIDEEAIPDKDADRKIVIRYIDAEDENLQQQLFWMYAVDPDTNEICGQLSIRRMLIAGYYFIGTVFVRRDRRREGIASELVRAAVEFCATQKEEFVCVSCGIKESNAASRALFSKHGFQPATCYDDGSAIMYSYANPSPSKKYTVQISEGDE